LFTSYRHKQTDTTECSVRRPHWRQLAYIWPDVTPR